MEHLVDTVFRDIDSVSAGMALLMFAVGMMLESLAVPLPSELILTLAGITAARGKFGPGAAGLIAPFAAATAGCLLGSSIAYAIGYFGGSPLVERFGRYILVTPHRLHAAERWIDRYGPIAILLGRLMFAVRAVISYPVGVLRMGYRRFLLFTLFGCSLWNLLGMLLGYFYGEAIRKVLHQMSLGMFAALMLVLLMAAGCYFWKTHLPSRGQRGVDADGAGNPG